MIQNTMLGDMFDIWLAAQDPLAHVERWGVYRNRNQNLRSQSTLHHQFSICVVLVTVLHELGAFNLDLCTEFIKDAFTVHDIPEGLLGMKQDVRAGDKTTTNDLHEYNAFRALYEKGHKGSFEYLHRAYLLQYAHKSDEALKGFPVDALETIEYIRKMYPHEAQLFPALEHWEYLFYAYECYKEKGDEIIFVNVLRCQLPKLIAHARSIPGYAAVLFPSAFEQKLTEFLQTHTHVPVV